RVGILVELATLAALVIGEKDKSTTIDAFEQNGASGRAAILRRRAQRHRVWFRELRCLGFLKPFFELTIRVAGEILLSESRKRVIFSEVGQCHACDRGRRDLRCQNSSGPSACWSRL